MCAAAQAIGPVRRALPGAARPRRRAACRLAAILDTVSGAAALDPPAAPGGSPPCQARSERARAA